MKLFVFAALLVLADAESGFYADLAPHLTAGYTAYDNGAVVPEDTNSVKLAKAVHYNAKANAAFKANPFVYGQHQAVYAAPQVHIAKPVNVEYKAPAVEAQKVVAYAAPQHHQQIYGVAHQQQVYAMPQHHQQVYAMPQHHQQVYAMPQHHQQVYAMPQHHQQTYAFPQMHQQGFAPATYAHAVYKREAEAEAEAEPESYYFNGGYNNAGHFAYPSHYSNYASSYGYRAPYNRHSYGSYAPAPYSYHY